MDFSIFFSSTALWTVTGLVIVFLLLRSRVQIIKFIQEVRIELNKCSWPWDPKIDALNIRKYRELIEQTLIVIVSALLLGGTVTAYDLFIHPVVGLVTGGSK